MRGARFVGVVALATVVASCGSGSGKANTVGVVTQCSVARQAPSTTVVASTSFTFTVTGGSAVPTAAVQPHCLPNGHVAHALQVAEAIRASGVGCDTASLDKPKATPEIPGGQLLEQVSCDVGDESVAITLSLSPTIDLSLMRTGACFVNKARPGNLTYVKGTNWIAAPERAATAHLIGDRLHASVETFHC